MCWQRIDLFLSVVFIFQLDIGWGKCIFNQRGHIIYHRGVDSFYMQHLMGGEFLIVYILSRPNMVTVYYEKVMIEEFYKFR